MGLVDTRIPANQIVADTSTSSGHLLCTVCWIGCSSTDISSFTRLVLSVLCRGSAPGHMRPAFEYPPDTPETTRINTLVLYIVPGFPGQSCETPITWYTYVHGPDCSDFLNPLCQRRADRYTCVECGQIMFWAFRHEKNCHVHGCVGKMHPLGHSVQIVQHQVI